MENLKHTLHAWTQEGDLIPTLYVHGEITTGAEKPVVTLDEASPQGINPKILLLTQSPDVYDPKGKSLLMIRKYSKTLTTMDQYTEVTIRGTKGDIHLKVEHRSRD